MHPGKLALRHPALHQTSPPWQEHPQAKPLWTKPPGTDHQVSGHPEPSERPPPPPTPRQEAEHGQRPLGASGLFPRHVPQPPQQRPVGGKARMAPGRRSQALQQRGISGKRGGRNTGARRGGDSHGKIDVSAQILTIAQPLQTPRLSPCRKQACRFSALRHAVLPPPSLQPALPLPPAACPLLPTCPYPVCRHRCPHDVTHCTRHIPPTQP